MGMEGAMMALALEHIPSSLMGLPGSVFPGVYEAISEEIDAMSAEMFS